MFDLEAFKALGGKARRRRLSEMSQEEKLEVVDAIIDRDAAFWKEYNRAHCDFGYYWSHIDGGLALTERQR